MFERVLHITGLAHTSNSEFLAIILLLSICSLGLGWLTDGVMQDLGFGVFGNTLLILLSGVVGICAFSWVAAHYLGRYLTSNDLMIVVVAASVFSVSALLALALAKKYSTSA